LHAITTSVIGCVIFRFGSACRVGVRNDGHGGRYGQILRRYADKIMTKCRLSFLNAYEMIVFLCPHFRRDKAYLVSTLYAKS
jgi:hypothetical protein